MPDLDPVEYDPFADKTEEFAKKHHEQMQTLTQILAALVQVLEVMATPKRIVRDKDGKAAGLEHVHRVQ